MKRAIYLILALSTSILLQAQSITGTVNQIDSEKNTFELIHIKSSTGLELKETIIVRVGDGDMWVDYNGKKIRGELSQSDGTLWLQKIWPINPEAEAVMQSVNSLLRADTAVRQRRQFRKEGDYGINFSMFNEQGDIVQFNQFKGQWVIMNFIFTRCRMPEMCPAQTARMVSIQHMAKDEGIKNLQQISVSFDPSYDTPGILNQYAEVKRANTDTFSFLTGSKDAMLDVLKQYGVIAFESKNIIDHTVTTLLFDKSGMIVIRKDGTKWNANDFIQKILKAENKIHPKEAGTH